MEETTVTVSSIMTEVSSGATSVLGMVGDVAGTIVSEPLLVITCIVLPLCGIGVGMLTRLMRARA